MLTGHFRRFHVTWQWGSPILKKKKSATPLPWDFWACLQELPLPTHSISFGECSDVCLQLLCSDADLEKLLHMDAFNHTALNETSKDSTTHHSCHVFSALWGLHCCAKPLQSHYQLAYDQMITKVNTHTLTQHKEQRRSHSWAMQPEIFWHPLHKLNNHIANAFNVKEQPFSWPSCACHLALSASEKGSLAFILLWKPFLFQEPLSHSSPLPTAPPVRCLWRPVLIRGWH